MIDRVPLTLFTNAGAITTHATWNDPLNPTDPWTGYPYQWLVTVTIQSQTHSDPTTPRPFTYNGLDVTVGNWLIFTSTGMALEIISITSQTDSVVTFIVEDVSLHNLLNNAGQTGQGIGPVSAYNVYDCLIINLNSSGVPVFSNISDYAVPVNLISDITNRFQFRNYVEDFIPANQTAHNFSIGDVIYLDAAGIYHTSISTDIGAATSVGIVSSIDQPNVGDFTYRPSGRYVKNLPTLPGSPGQRLYVSESVPGGLTTVPPSSLVVSVYIKITDTSAIFSSSSGSSGGSSSTGNLVIFGNTIAVINPNGNINLTPSGTGTVNAPSANIGNVTASTGYFNNLEPNSVVIAGANGKILTDTALTFNIANSILTVTNVSVTNSLDLNANRIVNVLDPIENQDVATKSYVDAVAQGLNAKEAVLVATIGALDATFTDAVAYGSLTSNVYESLILDGVTLSVNDRILVKDQVNKVENGLYRVVQLGSVSQPWILSRTTDFNGQGVAGDVKSGDFVFVEDGDTHGSTGWVMTSPNPVSVNVSNIFWTQFSSAGVIQAGFGLIKNGTILDVNVSAIIDPTTGLNSTPGISGFNVIEISLASNTPLEFNLGSLRITDSLAGVGLEYNNFVGNINVSNNLSHVTQLGVISAGTWQATEVAPIYGGTGLTTLGAPAQVLTVNNAGTALEYAYRSKLTESTTAPTTPPPADGDRWFDTVAGIMFTRITDSNGGHWVEV